MRFKKAFFTFLALSGAVEWSVQWSGKHVGKYLGGYTSYRTGTGLRTFLYLLVQIIDLTRLLGSRAAYQKSFENREKALFRIWMKQKPNVLN